MKRTMKFSAVILFGVLMLLAGVAIGVGAANQIGEKTSLVSKIFAEFEDAKKSLQAEIFTQTKENNILKEHINALEKHDLYEAEVAEIRNVAKTVFAESTTRLSTEAGDLITVKYSYAMYCDKIQYTTDEENGIIKVDYTAASFDSNPFYYIVSWKAAKPTIEKQVMDFAIGNNSDFEWAETVIAQKGRDQLPLMETTFVESLREKYTDHSEFTVLINGVKLEDWTPEKYSVITG